MCKFSFKVKLCGCEDAACKSETGSLVINEAGHVSQILEYERVSAKCENWFLNTNRKRLVLQYGFSEAKPESLEDCKGNKEGVVHGDKDRDWIICHSCQSMCSQPAISPRIYERVAATIILGKAEQEAQRAENLTTSDFLKGCNPQDGLEKMRKMRLRMDFCTVMRHQPSRPNVAKELEAFKIRELLYEEEKAHAEDWARRWTTQLPEARRIEIDRRQSNGLVFTDEDFENEGSPRMYRPREDLPYMLPE